MLYLFYFTFSVLF